MIAWTDGNSVRLVESEERLDWLLDQALRVKHLRRDLSVTRGWLVAVSLALLATWCGLAYALAVSALT